MTSCSARRVAGAYFCALITTAVCGADNLIPLEISAETTPSSNERLAWVFTFQSDSDEVHTDLMKGAVLSSIKHGEGSLMPFCMYRGSEDSDAYKWMREQGVTVIKHTPSWQDKLWNAVKSWIERQKNPKQPSSSRTTQQLYGKEAILGTFQRVDIPILDELKSFEYVLYTDTDVYFRGPVRMKDIGFLPKTIAVARPTSTIDGKDSSNAGMYDDHAQRDRP